MTLDPRTCLYPGRFQPFHNGHAMVVEALAARYARVVVTISQTHLSHTPKDPFTGGERYEIVKSFLTARGLADRFDVIPVPSDAFPTTWVPLIRSITPPFQVVYARNPLIKTVWGYKIDDCEMPRPTSGTRVREAMTGGEDWKTLVPATTAEYIEMARGVERVAQLALGANY